MCMEPFVGINEVSQVVLEYAVIGPDEYITMLLNNNVDVLQDVERHLKKIGTTCAKESLRCCVWNPDASQVSDCRERNKLPACRDVKKLGGGGTKKLMRKKAPARKL